VATPLYAIYIHGHSNGVLRLRPAAAANVHRAVGHYRSDVRILGVRIRSDPMYRLGSAPESCFRGRCGVPGSGTLFQFTGSNFEVAHCDVFHGGEHLLSTSETDRGEERDSTRIRGATYGYVHDNQLAYGVRCYHFEQVSRIIMEHNEVIGAGLAAAGNDIVTFYGTATEMIWFAHNNQYRQFGLDHEMMTLDGSGGALLQSVNCRVYV